MGASCGGTCIDSSACEALGLQSNHAYAILAVVVVQSIRLLKLRNPWGSGEWLGDWNDKSLLWTDEIANLLKLNDNDDGVFWMCWSDFILYFESVTICKSRPEWHLVSVPDEFVLKQTAPLLGSFTYGINITRNTWMYFSVIQKSLRGLHSGEYYDIGYVLVSCLKNAPNDFASYRIVDFVLPYPCQVIGSDVLLLYDPDRSYLFSAFSFSAKNATNFVSSFYGANVFEVSLVLSNPLCLYSTLRLLAGSNSTSCNPEITHSNACLYKLVRNKCFLYYACNFDENSSVWIQLHFKNCVGLICSRVPISNSECQLSTVLPPMSQAIMCMLVLDPLPFDESFVSFSFNCSYQMIEIPPFVLSHQSNDNFPIIPCDSLHSIESLRNNYIL